MQTGGVGSEPDNLTPCLCTMRVARNDEVPHYASRMHSASPRLAISALRSGGALSGGHRASSWGRRGVFS